MRSVRLSSSPEMGLSLVSRVNLPLPAPPSNGVILGTASLLLRHFFSRGVAGTAALMFIFAASKGTSQSITVPSPTTLNVTIPTISTTEPVDVTTHETVSLSSGVVAFSLPVVSFPQRGDQALTIGFVLSGNQYALRETQAQFNSANQQAGQFQQLHTQVTGGRP